MCRKCSAKAPLHAPEPKDSATARASTSSRRAAGQQWRSDCQSSYGPFSFIAAPPLSGLTACWLSLPTTRAAERVSTSISRTTPSFAAGTQHLQRYALCWRTHFRNDLPQLLSARHVPPSISVSRHNILCFRKHTTFATFLACGDLTPATLLACCCLSSQVGPSAETEIAGGVSHQGAFDAQLCQPPAAMDSIMAESS